MKAKKHAFKEAGMKNSVFSKVSVRHAFSVFLVGFIALGVSNMAAADKSDHQSQSNLDQKSANMAKDQHDGQDLWERNLQLDGLQVLDAQVYVGNTCYTPVGSCAIFNGPLPVGAPCWCGSPVYGPFGRVGTP
jgi:hypothetical protein